MVLYLPYGLEGLSIVLHAYMDLSKASQPGEFSKFEGSGATSSKDCCDGCRAGVVEPEKDQAVHNCIGVKAEIKLTALAQLRSSFENQD
jgi:hypothetical protein